MASTFADRFWFARKQADIGAPTLMRAVARELNMPEGDDLSPSLVSTIERRGLKSSSYNDAFAKVLGVDPSWLANDEGTPPRGFDAERAHAARLAETTKNRRGAGATVTHLSSVTPRPEWADEGNEEQRAQRMQARLMSDLVEFALLVGAPRAIGFIKTVEPILTTFAAKEVPGQNKSRSPK